MNTRHGESIHSQGLVKSLLWFNLALTLYYFSWWLVPGHIDNPILYFLLFVGEIYHVLMTLFFWHTLWPHKNNGITPEPLSTPKEGFLPDIDIYIPVAGEPLEVIEATVKAVKDLNYKNFKVYLLNDGFVAKKSNWREAEDIARNIGVHCITRKSPGGAKAGNINNALKKTAGEIIVIFDADMKPHRDFLKKVLPWFINEKMGFVQVPQYYKNHSLNEITSGAWEQQEIFFGPVMEGKNRSNSAFICGTNVAIRRKALESVGGMQENNVAEDFVTSILIHQKGWRSHYINEILAEGLAPEDLLSYVRQQRRWARGSLETLISDNPLFKRGLTWSQKIQYLSSSLFYLNGIFVLIDMTIPLVYLYGGLRPVSATTSSFALFFIPYMFLILYSLYVVSKGNITFRAISFSVASWPLQLSAIKSLIFREKSKFDITEKKSRHGNFSYLALPHFVYIFTALGLTTIGLFREGINPSILTNVVWVIFNIAMFSPFIRAAIPNKVINYSIV